MIYRLTAPLSAMLFTSVFLLNACAPTAANRADESTSVTTPTAVASSADQAKSGGLIGDSMTSSSLDALQKGEAAAEGPLKNIYFAFDQYTLSAEAREVLKANAKWLKTNPSVRVEIEGHCDPRGTNEYNLALGAKRAQSAQDYLATLGVSADRLKTVSYGEEIPVCKEQSEDCWQKNRHARFAVDSAGPVS